MRLGGMMQVVARLQPDRPHRINRGERMRTRAIVFVFAAVLATTMAGMRAGAQSTADTVDAHVGAAKAAAGANHPGLFTALCSTASIDPSAAPQRGQRAGGPAPAGPPDRSTWHAEPVKVFDNLYYVGMT